LKLDQNTAVLTSIRGLYDNLIEVVRDYFELYASIPARTYPSIISIIYSEEVQKEELGQHVYDVMSQGLYEYKIFPEGDRPFYQPVQFIVPLEKNWHMSGYDLASDEIIERAVAAARDSNMVAATPFYNIRKPDTMGFFLISPIYEKNKNYNNIFSRRNNFVGVLLLEIDGKKFFETALGKGTTTDTAIVFEIFDIDESGNERLIYESENAELYAGVDWNPVLEEERRFDIANREIILKFKAIPNFGGEFQRYMPLAALIGSLILSFAFFGFVLSVITSRTRALDLAERMTRSQRRIVESSKDIIAVLDWENTWRSMNPASMEVFGYDPDEMTGSSIDILFENVEEKEKFYALKDRNEEEFDERFDLKMVSKDQEVKWIDWNFTISKTDRLIYCVGRDVTLERLAAEQARIKNKQILLAEQYAREANEFKSYFVTKLSHQMRNSLTGILGYLQLVDQKIYENEEEHDQYVRLAEESSEEMFTFVSDIVDAALAEEETQTVLQTVRVGILFEDFEKEYNKDRSENIHFVIDEESSKSTLLADRDILQDIMVEIFDAMIMDNVGAEITVQAQENPYEGATEIQILTPGDTLVEDMIKLYKNSRGNLIEALKDDKKDILLRLATAASNVRRLNGSLSVDSFGPEEGNVVMLTLPRNKKIEV
ncbi:MAG: CHASE domain-containing protein, partial [Bacteroidota bacterium]